MRSRLTIALLVVAGILAVPAFAQNATVGQPDPTLIGKDQAQQMLKEVNVDKFEDAAYWYSAMPLDMGVTTARGMVGAPAGKQPLEGETALSLKENDTKVLGVKVSFFRRGYSYFTVHPERPIAVEGIVKTVSVWVVGRNYNHVLKLLFTDFRGQQQELTVGTLNFTGWKKLTVAIPPSILQTDSHYTYVSGIRITGLKIECDPMDAFGTYYVYFDGMTAVTDLIGYANRDADDMADSW